MAGLSAHGLVIRTQPELVRLLEARLSEKLPGFEFKDTPEEAVLNAIAEELAIAWETLRALYAASYPNSATGILLDQVALLTGTRRRAPTRSRVVAKANLNAGATLGTGALAAVEGDPDAQFRVRAPVTNSGAAAADLDVELEAVDTGPIAAPAGTLRVIVTPVAGWNAITNPLDAELGAHVEDDASLRRRREDELAAAGGSTVDAIRADLLRVTELRAARVFENVSDVVDANGLPPHSFEAVVLGGADQEIADQLWKSKPAGIQAHGALALTVEDSAGERHTIRFSRPIDRPIRFSLTVRVDVARFPADGVARIQRNIVALGDREHGVGDDVVRSRFYCTAFEVAGVTDVPSLLIGFQGGPLTTANLPIASRELATFDTSRVVVIIIPS